MRAPLEEWATPSPPDPARPGPALPPFFFRGWWCGIATLEAASAVLFRAPNPKSLSWQEYAAHAHALDVAPCWCGQSGPHVSSEGTWIFSTRGPKAWAGQSREETENFYTLTLFYFNTIYNFNFFCKKTETLKGGREVHALNAFPQSQGERGFLKRPWSAVLI